LAPHPTNPLLRSLVGPGWPPIAGPKAAQVLALLAFLEETQWWSEERLRTYQLGQLARLARHAARTVPFWRERFAAAGVDAADFGPQALQQLPILERAEVQEAGVRLLSTHVPREHGAVRDHRTSGATGEPLRVWGTGVTRLFWRALSIRDHLWHGRDFGARLAKIRHSDHPGARPPRGKQYSNWGAGTRDVVRTGPCFLLGVDSSVEEQAQFLRHVRPHALATYPSVAGALAGWFLEHGDAPSELLEVRTFGEVLEPEVQSAIHHVFAADVVDTYASQEVGHIALQCPGDGTGDGYHFQEENVLVEVLDAQGRAVEPGGVGRVVVSTLQNFATPLFRYEIGDYARVGGTCACGRGLATLERVLGRRRNMLVLPDGRATWPAFAGAARPRELPLHRPFQLVQRTRDAIEVLVERSQPFTPEEETHVRAWLQGILGDAHALTIRCVAALPRHQGGKFESFESELSVA
jgi:phenylacetate-CoA ligase